MNSISLGYNSEKLTFQAKGNVRYYTLITSFAKMDIAIRSRSVQGKERFEETTRYMKEENIYDYRKRNQTIASRKHIGLR